VIHINKTIVEAISYQKRGAQKQESRKFEDNFFAGFSQKL
jgi:hypothetical protein